MNYKILFSTLLFLGSITIGQAQIYEGISATASLELINDNIDNPNFVILDVRTPGEHNPEHIEGAINRNFYDSDFSDQLDLLDKNKKYLIHCKSGGRSGITLGTMEDLGFAEVYDMLGGMNSWNANSYPVTNLFAPQIMFVSANDFPLETIGLGNTEEIAVTLTNRANSTLTFEVVTVLEGTEFSTDFDLSTALLGSEDYTFTIFYTPTDVMEDMLTFAIESNAGTAEVTITRNGNPLIGTADVIAGRKVSVFPNPSADILQFKGLSTENAIIEVINIHGQTILQKQLQKKNDIIDISTIAKGTYFVKIKENELVFSKKVVIE